MFCCRLLNAHSSIAIILMGKRELVALLNLSSWCLIMVEWLFLTVPWGCLRFVSVVFLDHTHFFAIESLCISIPLNRQVCYGKCVHKDIFKQTVLTIESLCNFKQTLLGTRYKNLLAIRIYL